MATLIDSAKYTANEVYQMEQTDGCEGAASGASYGGLGVNNYPHQQLANRTAWLYNALQTLSGYVMSLLAWMGLFKCLMAANGYLQFGATDVNLGGITLTIQWGVLSVTGMTAAQLKNQPLTAPFAIPFSNACVFAAPLAWLTNALSGAGAFSGGLLLPESGGFTNTSLTIFSDWNDSGSINISSGGSPGLTGILWFAIGY